MFEAAGLFRPLRGHPARRKAATPSAWPLTGGKVQGEQRGQKNIVIGLTGTGYFDMVAYGKYGNDGEMRDVIPTDEDLQRGFATIPSFPGNE